MKRFLSVFLVVVMVLSALIVGLVSCDDPNEDNKNNQNNQNNNQNKNEQNKNNQNKNNEQNKNNNQNSNRIFKDETGITPRAYLVDVRLQHATKLLEDLSILLIMMALHQFMLIFPSLIRK